MQEAENTVKRGTAHGSSRGRRRGADAALSYGEEDAYGKDTARAGPLGPLAGFKRLTPDSRAPAKQGEGLCLAGSLGGKEKSKKVVADDVSEHKLRNISPT